MENLEKAKLTTSLSGNMGIFKEIFENDDTLVQRLFSNPHTNIDCCIFHLSGMVDKKIINNDILEPILKAPKVHPKKDYLDYLTSSIIYSHNVAMSDYMPQIIAKLLAGNTILLAEGYSKVLIIDSQGWESRSIEEPMADTVLMGPREGFTESLTTNISLIRRKIQNKELKFKIFNIGARTNTKVCITYIEELAKEETLDKITRKLEDIDIDGILDIRYIQEFLTDEPFSIFNTYLSTEKPDVVAGKLLEGRFAILVDGSPIVATTPTLFIEYIMTNDDYYVDYYFSSMRRVLRTISFAGSFCIPSLYVALITYHHELIPAQLLMAIYSSRQSVPLPSLLEISLLLLSFDALRESSARIPGNIGQSIGIVGSLVLGTAAVEARFVSAPMIIIVGITAITAQMFPNLTGVSMVTRMIFLILSSLLGIYGFIFATLGLLIHLHSLRSQGISFMGNLSSLNVQDIKDTFFRAPWWLMRERPENMSDDEKRSGSGG